TALGWALILNPGRGQIRNGRISGFVTDSTSGESLPGANVFLKETQNGMAADPNGFYVINEISPGTYTLVVSYLGFKSREQSVVLDAGADLNRNIALAPSTIGLQEVVVSGERITRKFELQPSRITLSTRQIKSLPALAEPDLFRTLQAMPGVLSPSEFSTGLVIRGGNTDQNLILLDGITVYNPSHLGGVFSNFILDAVKGAELIKGGYNAEYGGRLSAVLNVTSREGNRKKFQGSNSISILSAQTTLEGPSYRGAWLVAARRTYFDQILKNTDLNVPPYYFYDFQGHVFTDLTSKDRLSISSYSGLDNLIFNDFDMKARWGNDTYSMNYRRLFSPNFIGKFMVASSRFRTYFNLGGNSGVLSDNIIDDQTISADFTHFTTSTFTLKFGGLRKQLGLSYKSGFGDTITFRIDENPVEAGAYAKIKWLPGPRFIIEPGLRMNYYSGQDQRWYPDLRLGLKWILSDDQYINFALGNYHQFIETVQDDFNPSMLDNWMAIDNSVKPATSRQVVLGLEQYFRNRYKLQIETYYKNLYNMLTFEDPRATADEEIATDRVANMFTPSDGYAYGLEFFLQKTTGSLTGWVAYTWSISRKIMHGQTYYTNWDREHVLNIIGSWIPNRKWELSGKWTYQTGQAYTPILGLFLQNLPGDPVTGFRTIPAGRNSGRYPPYHRLDLGAIRHIKWGRVKFDLNLQIINAYNRKNVFQYFYLLGSTTNGLDDDNDWNPKKDDLNGNGRPDAGEPHVDEPDEGRVQRETVSIFPLIPSIGISFDL
ncbi:MAG: carboxypeptidase-like regulatory domain-containing protein, partial [Fidelibacterota bacterium]